MAAKLVLLALAALAAWDILTGRNPADLIPLRARAALVAALDAEVES